MRCASTESSAAYPRLRVSFVASSRPAPFFDPLKQVQKDALRVFELSPGDYIPKLDNQLQKAGLGVTLWEGAYDGLHAVWLRWVDTDGTLIPTGAENTRQEQERAEKERERAEKLAAKLRSLGIDPDEIA